MEKIIQLGKIGCEKFNSDGRVYDSKGISPTLVSGMLGGGNSFTDSRNKK